MAYPPNTLRVGMFTPLDFPGEDWFRSEYKGGAPERPKSKYQKLADVLEWVNATRKSLGSPPLEELPKAKLGCPESCVIAAALPGYCRVGSWTANWYIDQAHHASGGDLIKSVDLPKHVVRFIEDFDSGQYPELVA